MKIEALLLEADELFTAKKKSALGCAHLNRLQAAKELHRDAKIIRDLARELCAALADAERYRWLRDECPQVDVRAGLDWMGQGSGIDAAIDAARAGKE